MRREKGEPTFELRRFAVAVLHVYSRSEFSVEELQLRCLRRHLTLYSVSAVARILFTDKKRLRCVILKHTFPFGVGFVEDAFDLGVISLRAS